MRLPNPADGRPRPIPGLLPLLLYVLLRGLDATVLKGLQDHGMAHPVDGENPISFCNVFFLGQVVAVGAALVLGGVFVSRRPAPIRSRPSPVSEARHSRRTPPRS